MAGIKWSEKDLQFLQDNYAQDRKELCATHLNRTVSSIDSKASRLGLKSEYNWTGSDTKYLIDNYSHLSKSDIAAQLNRTRGAVVAKAQELKLNKRDPNYYYKYLETDDRVTLLEEFKGAHTKILHKCNKCKYEWKASPAKIKYGRGCPQCVRKGYSKACIRWLDTFNNPNIQHAENGGEVMLGGYKVDGYDKITNTAYEFHGDIFHGNLDVFKESDRCNYFDRTKTAGQLWDATFLRMSIIARHATLIYIWERDFNLGKDYEIF